MRSRARLYEHGEKNSKYFYSLEKTNCRRKHVTSIINHEDKRITDPKKILQEQELFFKEIYTSKNMNPQLPEFSDFFENIECTLSQGEAATCEGEVTLEECYNVLKIMAANKSPRLRWFYHRVLSTRLELVRQLYGQEFQLCVSKRNSFHLSTTRGNFSNFKKEKEFRVFKKLETSLTFERGL